MIESSNIKGQLAELVYGFPPVRIENEAELAATEARVDELTGRTRTPAEEIYLDLLGTRIHEWEDEHEQIPDIHGPELIRVLLRERGQQQHDLVEAGVFATDSVTSEVLSGRRPFRLEHILAAARFFNLPAAAFLPEREPVGA